MKAPGRRWIKATLAAASVAASIAFAVGAFAPARPPAPPLNAAPQESDTAIVPRARASEAAEPDRIRARSDPSSADPVKIVATGDIACDPADTAFNGGTGRGDECRARSVARVISRIGPQALLTLGDHQYVDGRYQKFLRSYDLSYGAFKPITYPSVGNHEYYSSARARGFFEYFGTQAGVAGEGWYSFDLGAWHIVALNSNCSIVDCGRGSEQYTWLEEDLASDRSACTLAFWHAPRFSSGPHGPDPSLTPLWRVLQKDGAELVLSGHDHIYERFAPQDAQGARDPLGIRQFVVGTGGAELYPITAVQHNSRARSGDAMGVLRLVLSDGSYDWRFVPALDARFTDSGTADCI